MRAKELKISAIPENSKFSKIFAHIMLLTPFIPIVFLGILCYFNKEIFETLHRVFLEQKVFLVFFAILWFGGMLNMSREVFNYLLVEEVCYVENKVYYYQKIRKIFGMRKLIKNLEIPLTEILGIKEVKKPSFFYYFLNPVAHRNSIEIETRDGKKYKLMNSVVMVFKNRNSQSPISNETDERTKKIYNEVKNMISK